MLDRTTRQALALRAAALLPGRVTGMLSRRRHRCDGELLAGDLALLLRLAERFGWPALETLTPQSARVQARREAAALAGMRMPARVRTLELPGAEGALAARLYASRRRRTATGLVVWLHGGGWVLGDLDSHDALCRRLVHATQASVLAAAYRTAPEAPFPAAAEDAVAVADWAIENAADLSADPRRVAVAGDSAGANLAAVAAQALGHRLAAQLLLYPIADASCEHPSYHTFTAGPWLSGPLMRWFIAQYLPSPDDAHDPRASPLLSPGLAGGPPAYVGIANFDPLRDEGLALARRLAQAGVEVTLDRFGNQLHGYAELAGVSRSARAATLAAARWLRNRLI
jgi:acetyl esterase